MTTRVTRNSGLPAKIQAAESPKLPSETESSTQGVLPQAAPNATVAPWASVSGHEMYKKVQNLPDDSEKFEEKISRNPKKARKQGVGRNIDKFA